ncbi:MAG: hypothetical protein R3E89_16740 [Thiolinea sp.]
MRRNLAAKTFRHTERKPSRILRNFDIPTRIVFRQLAERGLTQMEVSTGDMPELLGRIGETLDRLAIRCITRRLPRWVSRRGYLFHHHTGLRSDDYHEAQLEVIRQALVEAVKI